ncbi:MAG: hypothetical protein MMC23_003740 [Stictis urceolatum]|nr:hypothetical protein [Stictis urceolata]
MPDARTSISDWKSDADANRRDEQSNAVNGYPSGAASRDRKKGKAKAKSTVPCRFWATRKGCRTGDSCPFLHDLPAPNDKDVVAEGNDKQQGKPEQDDREASAKMPETPGPSRVSKVDSSRVVAKPTPRTDARSFQIQQMERRFTPSVQSSSVETSLALQLRPSDPDFPFEMPYLDCVLHVPASYPSSQGNPRLNVRNKEMDRGYQINVERGFERIVANAPSGTLLGWMNTLDRKLEEFLTGERAETIKIIKYKTVLSSSISTPVPASLPFRLDDAKPTHTKQINDHQAEQIVVQKGPTSEEIKATSAQRTAEIRQLEARMSRLAGYSKCMPTDKTVYELPLAIRQWTELPASLQKLCQIRLTVPESYPLKPPLIALMDSNRLGLKVVDVDGNDAKAVMRAWDRRQKDSKGLGATLMGRVNDLVANIHTWVLEKEPEDNSKPPPASVSMAGPVTESSPQSMPKEIRQLDAEDDKPHIHIIRRPPEWNKDTAESDSTSSFSSSDTESDFGSEREDDTNPAAGPSIATSTPAHGIAIDLPSLALHNIELLTLNTLSITAKCLRCKNPFELTNLSPTNTTPKTSVCTKCSTPISAAFRQALMHPSSSRAGYIDLTGATPTDLLPSPFTPTCSSCSTPLHSPGLTGVRGDEPRAICRSCHQHLSFAIPEIKFLSLSTYSATHTGLPPRRKIPKEKLGLTAGEPLPKKGRCQHYSKSYRWFRFSCCDKVYACDRCHDAAEKHPNERAERMICGFCSREQRFRAEECGVCHAAVVGRKGGGFWEGGKGTRDKARMSRKDKRKYRRVGGGARAKGKD